MHMLQRVMIGAGGRGTDTTGGGGGGATGAGALGAACAATACTAAACATAAVMAAWAAAGTTVVDTLGTNPSACARTGAIRRYASTANVRATPLHGPQFLRNA